MTISTSKTLSLDWSIIGFMAFLHIGALFALFPSNFSWTAVGLALFLHWVTGGLGITLGFHRLLTHRSFKTPKWLEYFFIFCGTLACQGGVFDWVGLPFLTVSRNAFWWKVALKIRLERKSEYRIGLLILSVKSSQDKPSHLASWIELHCT